MECKICKKKLNSLGALQKHISMSHREESPSNYYILYINQDVDGKCKFCGDPAQFIGFTKGFMNICKNKECYKKSISPFGKEYKMKVNGLSESEYSEWFDMRQKELKIKTEAGFAKRRLDDPDFDKKNSRYCKEFWLKKGHSEEESIKMAHAESAKNRNILKDIRVEDPDYQKGKTWNSYKYWMEKGMDEEEAKLHVSKLQATFTKEKCIEQYGEIEGMKRWMDRQEKWCANNPKSNFSKISQELFFSIYEQLEDKEEIYFAQLNSNNGINNEYTLRLEGSIIKPDFISIKPKKIIEFDGDYWHDYDKRNRPLNKERERKRDELIKTAGYQIIRILEKNYNKDKVAVVKECVDFLKSN